MLRDRVILVVDDWEIDRIRVVEHLRSGLDAKFVVASDGLAALQAIDRHKPDLVVTDLVMPRMNGLQLVECIRRRYPFLPSVLITSRGSEQIAWRALEAGAVNYVPKQELGRLVDTVLSVLQLSIGCRRQEQLRGFWQGTQSRFCLENDRAAIPVLVSHLQQQAANMRGLDDTECFRLGVALNEALANAVHHGNLELSSTLREDTAWNVTPEMAELDYMPRPDYYVLAESRRWQDPYCRRRVHVTARESREVGRYTIRDEGPGFDKRVLCCDPTDPQNIGRPCGRGLFLIHAFMTRVEFNERGNEITMTHCYRPQDHRDVPGPDGDCEEGPAQAAPANPALVCCGTS